MYVNTFISKEKSRHRYKYRGGQLRCHLSCHIEGKDIHNFSVYYESTTVEVVVLAIESKNRAERREENDCLTVKEEKWKIEIIKYNNKIYI